MFKINGTTVAEPKKEGVTITDEPIWASNTGRAASGDMIGDIVAWKTTVQVQWPALSFSDTRTIVNAIKNAGPFFSITYNDLWASSTVTKRVYCSNIPRTIYSLVQGAQYHRGVTVTFIEQ